MHKKRVIERLERMASFSDIGDGIFRPFCSESAKGLYDEIKKWCQEDNISCYVDALANLRIRSEKYDPNKPTFIIGSHVDTVIHAGKYDGPLGFLIGIEVLLHMEAQNEAPPFNIEVVGFSDEEGARFNTTYLGSSAIAGHFDDQWLHLRDGADITMLESLQSFERDETEIKACKIENAMGYYEVHIEQGPVLEAKNLSVGLVSHIYGQSRIKVSIEGFAGHAGTVPMHMRKDAFACLAEFAVQMEVFALLMKKDIVATIGTCTVGPGSSNVIPGNVDFSIDLRSHSEEILDTAERHILSLLEKIVSDRQLKYEWTQMQRNPPTYCDEGLNALLADSITEHQGAFMSLPSGAGHDGVMMSRIAPISMLFVRCKEGISHHPSEFASEEDIQKALEVSITYLEKLSKQHE